MGRLLARVKPSEGWLVFLLAVSVVLCLVKSLLDAEWVPGDGAFVWLALVALLWGVVLAKSPLPGWLSLGAGLVTGVELSYILAAQALPRLGELWREASRVWPWLEGLFKGHPEMPVPFFQPFSLAYSRAVGFFYRLIWWYRAGAAGKESRDELIFWLILAVMLWGVSFFAAWRLFRGHRTLQAIFPLGFLLTSNVFYVSQGMGYVVAMLACILLLLLRMQFVELDGQWRRKGIAYSEDIPQEATLVGVVCIGVMMLVAAFLPVVTSYRTYEGFWRRFGDTWGRVERDIIRLLVDRPPAGVALVGISGSAGAGVPDAGEHDLGGPVQPGKDDVMRVWTDDLTNLELEEMEYGVLLLPKRYWRANTYDIYTGRGWQNSFSSPGEKKAGELLVAEKDPRKVYWLSQRYTVFKPGGLLFSVNEPLSVGQPVSAQYRAGGDFASARISADRYTVDSQVLQATVQELKNAPTRYPEWVERYLELPQALPVPVRVRKLAQEVTRGAETPFDKAQAIETYLRTLEYDLKVPEAPLGRDAVDHFLFDLKRGYCDHFASAMVVMARSVRVPARLAVGYATGELDMGQGEYVVREKDAHAWVEVYFPGYGWVEFEPTSNRGRFERPTASGLSDTPSAPGRGLGERGMAISVDIVALGKVLGLGSLVGLVLWGLWQLRTERIGRLPPRDFVKVAYARLCRWSGSMGLGPRTGQTPLEYAQFLGFSLERRARLMPVFSRWPRWDEGELSRDVERLSQAYIRALYSPHPLAEEEGEELAISWRRLRRRLAFMRLRGRK